MKKILKYFFVMAVALMLAPVSGKVHASGELQTVNYVPDENHVKVLGRTYYNGYGQRWLANTASGIEFSFNGTSAQITVVGDRMATAPYQEWTSDKARVAIFVNDQLVIDDCLNATNRTYSVFESETPQQVTVKMLKISENSLATIGISNICVRSTEGIQPTAPKARKIEFIGDSLTNGYGAEESNLTGHFTTATENSLLAADYKIAQALDADYSMVAISGFGVVSGVTDGPKDPVGVVPLYYDKVGYSTSNFGDGTNPGSMNWNFNQYQPDVVVMNIGTNDYSYTGDDPLKQAEFVDGYKEFLSHVRTKNPNAKIVCALGMCGTELYPCVCQAVADYKTETGDNNVVTLQYDQQLEADHINLHGHPSPATYDKAAAKMVNFIKETMGWQ